MRLSKAFCIGHAALLIVLWLVSLWPGNAMLPILVFILDFPISSLLSELVAPIPGMGGQNGFLFALLVVGSGWWFFLGSLIDKARARSGRAARENPFP